MLKKDKEKFKQDSEKETLACLIIDDPLLRPQYGCLNYAQLLQAMKEHRFFTEIAFIPWNYKRSDPRTVQLFTDNPDYFAICVHGCNHLRNEFGKGSYQELSSLSSMALWLMEQHKKLTGLPYDPVFVFPQGLFSSVAMQALRDQGYLAAFNSNLKARDREAPPNSEYQKPATMIYYNFPLFLRRNPKDKSPFIQDIDAGRPILIYKHPGDFRNGYKEITELVDEINSLGNIKWRSLLEIAEYYLGNKATPLRGNIIPHSYSVLFNSKVAFRRLLCEARDNYIETSNLLNSIYKIVREKVF